MRVSDPRNARQPGPSPAWAAVPQCPPRFLLFQDSHFRPGLASIHESSLWIVPGLSIKKHADPLPETVKPCRQGEVLSNSRITVPHTRNGRRSQWLRWSMGGAQEAIRRRCTAPAAEKRWESRGGYKALERPWQLIWHCGLFCHFIRECHFRLGSCDLVHGIAIKTRSKGMINFYAKTLLPNYAHSVCVWNY